MKLRHYLLMLMVVLIIGFLERLVFLVGGLTLLIGMMLIIYGDLTPEAQASLERRIAWLLGGLRTNAGRGMPVGTTLVKTPILKPNTPRRRRTYDDASS